jgi:E3 ubiquitin-protein ligase BRE1
MTNTTQRAALAAIKEELASVLKEKSDLLQRIAQLSVRVFISWSSTLTFKSTSPTRDEVEQSEPYRLLLAEIEHLSNEVSRLEQSSEKLREENTSLLSDRTKFKEDLIAEQKLGLDEANNQVQRIEKDLTRVRAVRDDLHFEVQNRKAREEETLHSAREISELADSREVCPSAFHGRS